jgi:hypothetical protein
MLIGVRVPRLHGDSRSAMEVGGKTIVHPTDFQFDRASLDHTLQSHFID